jgi:TPR repeat protein
MPDSTAPPSSSDPGAFELNAQGVVAYRTRSYASAAELFRKAADMGFADAQYNLGYCYKYGDGVPRDLTKSAEWFRKAEEQWRADSAAESAAENTLEGTKDC